ncbi:MAG: hypothetical protein ACYDH9_25425 [Limisphaerales bacterium]
MKVISQPISKTRRGRRTPPAPRVDPNLRPLHGRELIRWLESQGAKPVDPATKRRLIAAGHWGMPEE